MVLDRRFNIEMKGFHPLEVATTENPTKRGQDLRFLDLLSFIASSSA
jgi:hypothetical protein